MTAPLTTDAAGTIAPNTAAAAAPAPVPTHEEHASMLHSIFANLEKLLHLAANPAVMALLPAKYQGYALAAAAIDQAVTGQ